MRDVRVTREAIEKTAAGMRAHLAQHGHVVTQDELVKRAIRAQVKEDNIREEGR